MTSNNVLGKVPPHSEEAEKSLLGAVLLDGDRLIEVMTLVEPEDFYVTAHQKVYAACITLYASGKRVDSTLILEELRPHRVAAGEPDGAGGAG